MSRVSDWISGHRWESAAVAASTLLAAVAIVFALSSGDSADAGGSDDFQAFQDCLEEQGVEVPEGPPSSEAGAPPDGEGFMPPDGAPQGAPPEGGPPQGAPMFGGADQEALSACQDLMPEPPQGQGLPSGSSDSVPLPNN